MIAYTGVGQGPPVVLLHGVGLDHTMWRRVSDRLAPDFELWLPDLRGHGRSPAAAPGITAADLAADVRDILPGPVHLVGFSLGALVAAQLALDNPELVQSLSLVSSVCRRSPEQRQAVLGRLATARTDMKAAAEAAVTRWFRTSWAAAEPDLAREVFDQLISNDPVSYAACYRVFATADEELWPRLPEIGVPTLAITGAEDTGSTPQMSALLAATVQAGRCHVVAGTGHLLPLEAPAELASQLTAHFRSPAQKRER